MRVESAATEELPQQPIDSSQRTHLKVRNAPRPTGRGHERHLVQPPDITTKGVKDDTIPNKASEDHGKRRWLYSEA